MSKRLCLIAMALCSVQATGCIGPTGGGGMNIWAASASEQVALNGVPEIESDVYSRSRNQIELTAAANEVVSFQLAISGTLGLAGAALEFGSLVGRGGHTAAFEFSPFLESNVTISPAPSWAVRRYGAASALTVGDVLVPLASPRLGGRVPVSSGTSVVWVDCRVPADCAADEYVGQLTVLRGGSRSIIGIVIKVLPFALPRERHLAIIAGVNAAKLAPYGGNDAIRDLFALLADHRVNPYLIGVAPKMRFDADGAVALDWTEFDAIDNATQAAVVQRIGGDVWSAIPVSRNQPPAAMLGGLASPEYAAVLRQYVQACSRHMAAGRDDAPASTPSSSALVQRRLFVDLSAPIPGEPRPSTYADLARLGRIAKLGDASLPFLNNLFPVSMQPYGWQRHTYSDLSEVTDIWATSAQFFEPRRMSQLRQLGAQVWLAPDAPAFGGCADAEAAPTDVRAIGWHAYLRGTSVWLADVTDLPNRWSASTPIAPGTSRHWLVYPGQLAGMTGVLPSRRLKLLLRAAQDYEYLSLLGEHGREATARLIAESLVSATGVSACVNNFEDAATHTTVTNPAQWELARRLMGDEIVRAIGGAAADSDRVNWNRFVSGTRRVIAWCEGVRLTPLADGRGLKAEVRLLLENQRVLPSNGVLRFGSLPIGWTADEPETAVSGLPGSGRSRFRLAARIAEWPSAVAGHIALPVELQIDGDAAVQIPVFASVMSPLRRSGPAAIDGHLEDWEMAAGNVASDFVSVGPAAQAGQTVTDRPRTGNATTAYVSRDADALYLAIRCDGETSDRYGGDNSVRYDALMPAGEDVVEVILHPGGDASDSGDLYHLAFKARGSMWAERGIGTPRPIGSRQPWGLDVRYAITTDRTGWTVEVRVPLTAFGDNAASKAVWGVDFARFSAADGRYSIWSGQPRYAYSPQGLGNLRWSE